ncbi:hypothetical protein NDU88_000242 [Pleurodeles waltl]|uniref:Uncharacterized protein n=1 Tax=Pleurodeles waltl TaxID=8319 RepID=A0AAV7P7R6_PLEWA|nr:hypothetical protein NDU88_000242 [Pleurodeles waltl]
MHSRALRIWPHKGKAPIKLDALTIIAGSKASKEMHRGKAMQEWRLPKWESAPPSVKRKLSGGSPEGKQNRGNPKRERWLPNWEPAPLSTPELQGKGKNAEMLKEKTHARSSHQNSEHPGSEAAVQPRHLPLFVTGISGMDRKKKDALGSWTRIINTITSKTLNTLQGCENRTVYRSHSVPGKHLGRRSRVSYCLFKQFTTVHHLSLFT